MAEGGKQDCEQQKTEIGRLIKSELKKGDKWYLIDTKWFKQWKKFVGYDSWDTGFVGDPSAHPGPMDNSPILKDDGAGDLKETLIDELDYQLVPEEAWNKLVTIYGVMEPQKPICRKVIEQGMFVKHCKVEVYLMDLKLCPNDKMDNVISKQFSRADKIDDIEKAMRKLFEIKEEKDVRLWNKYMSNTFEPLNNPKNTVQDSGLYEGQVIVIEEQNDDGTWPRQTKQSVSSTSQQSTSKSTETKSSFSTRSGNSFGNTYSRSSYDNYKSRSTSKPGLCGLSNLGNTCFMNSALQCMSNVPALTNFFLAGKWKSELNVNNPLGMNGEIAKSYAELVHDVWSGRHSYTIPRSFKIAVGRFAEQFSGYQQQDSQELMAFLLDGLHEDLNRIKKKPYVEVKDADGRPDEVVAKEAWEGYLKRNDSIIVDLFHGLLKSTLVCPECNKVSIQFDPFCYLSLPLPQKRERYLEIFFIPLDPSKKAVHYKLTVPKHGQVIDLCKALGEKTSIAHDDLLVTDVYNHKFHKVFNPEESLSHIMDRDDIFMYELPKGCQAEDSQVMVLPMYRREIRSTAGSAQYTHYTHQLFGQPLLVPVPKHNCTYDVLYNCVLDRMSRYVKRPEPSEEWWKLDEDAMQTSSNGDDDEGGEESSEADEEEAGPRRMFTFSMVNSYGSADMAGIKDDGKPITFNSRSYVAMDWDTRAKNQFYDEKTADLMDADESVNRKAPTKKTVQLTECIDLFTSKEQLGANDTWYCPKCKEHVQASKKFDLWKLPQYLVVHLKRFQYNRYWRDKLDTLVEYPARGLSMKKWIIDQNHDENTMYDLIAVSNHYGGMGGGHYTAYGKNRDGHWYYFDDSSVSQSSEDEVVTKAGYVLVYRRRGAADECDEALANGFANGKSDDDMDVN